MIKKEYITKEIDGGAMMQILIFRPKYQKIGGADIEIKSMLISSRISGNIGEILVISISISIPLSFSDNVIFPHFRKNIEKYLETSIFWIEYQKY